MATKVEKRERRVDSGRPMKKTHKRRRVQSVSVYDTTVGGDPSLSSLPRIVTRSMTRAMESLQQLYMTVGGSERGYPSSSSLVNVIVQGSTVLMVTSYMFDTNQAQLA
ncbi:hypothetical protein ACLOJK_020018 [Asimina triloba]